MFNKKKFYILAFTGIPKDQLEKIQDILSINGVNCLCVDKPVLSLELEKDG